MGDMHQYVGNIIAKMTRAQAWGQDERHLEPVVHDGDVNGSVLDERHGVM
jgi:hypothetical protein